MLPSLCSCSGSFFCRRANYLCETPRPIGRIHRSLDDAPPQPHHPPSCANCRLPSHGTPLGSTDCRDPTIHHQRVEGVRWGGEKDREVERLGVNEPSATAAVSRDSSWKIRGGHDGTYQGSVIILSGLFQFVSTSRQLEAFLPESSCARCVGNRRLRLRPLHHFI